VADAGRVKTDELDPQAEARRRLALAQIRQYPDPVLRMQAREVGDFDDDLARLVERMARLMTDANGVGLAATQVGVLRRVFVFRARDEEDARVVVNPEVDEEGCLSLQGILVPVERHVRIIVAGVDETGAEVRYELDELPARVAQHELDHLDGVLILERTTPESRREALAVLRPRVALA
jgi:peptide deformylase